MEFFQIEDNQKPEFTEVEPDPISIEINQPAIIKRFTNDEWLVIGLYMMNGDSILSYNQVFVSNDKRKNNQLSKVFFQPFAANSCHLPRLGMVILAEPYPTVPFIISTE